MELIVTSIALLYTSSVGETRNTANAYTTLFKSHENYVTT